MFEEDEADANEPEKDAEVRIIEKAEKEKKD